MGYYKEWYLALVSLVWSMVDGTGTHKPLIRSQVPYSARFGYIVNHPYFWFNLALPYYSMLVWLINNGFKIMLLFVLMYGHGIRRVFSLIRVALLVELESKTSSLWGTCIIHFGPTIGYTIYLIVLFWIEFCVTLLFYGTGYDDNGIRACCPSCCRL